MGVDLAAMKPELQRLRQGQALAQPQVVLRSSPMLRRCLAGESAGGESPALVALAAVDGLTAAISRLSETDQLIARTEFNLDPRHSYPTLTERQEALALALGCTAKTIRRRADRVLDALALIIASGVITCGHANQTASATRYGEPHGTPRRDAQHVLRQLWCIHPGARVDVVCSEIPADEAPEYAHPGDRNYLRYAKFADLDTLIYVRTRLAQLATDAVVRDFSPGEHHDTNADAMIVIGGPPWNAKYREFLPQLPYYFEPHPLGQDDPLIVPQLNNLRLGPRWSPRSELVHDIAVFTRLRLASGTTAVLLGGCLTLGVLGAARAFLHEQVGADNAAWLAEHVGDSDAVVVTEARRVGGMTDVTSFTDTAPLLVLGRSHPGESFTVLTDNTSRYQP
jgi:hypothetical protein